MKRRRPAIIAFPTLGLLADALFVRRCQAEIIDRRMRLLQRILDHRRPPRR